MERSGIRKMIEDGRAHYEKFLLEIEKASKHLEATGKELNKRKMQLQQRETQLEDERKKFNKRKRMDEKEELDRKKIELEKKNKAKTLLELEIDSLRFDIEEMEQKEKSKPKGMESEKNLADPWFKDLKKIEVQLVKYSGYQQSKRKAPKYTFKSNKIIQLGGTKYHIQDSSVRGRCAQVFKAFVNSDPDVVVALKVQKSALSWEFYMYQQLEERIPNEERLNFGHALELHQYFNLSVMICNYLPNGTLQQAIMSYSFKKRLMEEVLCIYYTIEMLHILETLHNAGIIHGDFKSSDLLIRHAGALTTDGFRNRSGPWRDQGLCLVDWERGIDLHLFPDNVYFEGCHKSAPQCTALRLQEKPWKFQVDTYGLCAIVHLMLHNVGLSLEKEALPDGGFLYRPVFFFKPRQRKVNLWENLFSKLLNLGSDNDVEVLRNLREAFQDYMCSDPLLLKQLIELLEKHRASLESETGNSMDSSMAE